MLYQCLQYQSRNVKGGDHASEVAAVKMLPLRSFDVAHFNSICPRKFETTKLESNNSDRLINLIRFKVISLLSSHLFRCTLAPIPCRQLKENQMVLF